MTLEEPAEGSPAGAYFDGFILRLLSYLDVATDGENLTFSLAPGFQGGAVLEDYLKKWRMERWTPLALANALADFKRRIGGEAKVVAVAPDSIELSQTKCEFGEPKEGPYRGNMCGVCASVYSEVARSSGLADGPAELGATIAKGWRACKITLPLA